MSELYAGVDDEESPASEGDGASNVSGKDGVEYDIVAPDGKVLMRTNQGIIDDPNSQVMTMEDIEVLKAEDTSSGRELVAKILQSHSALDKKTAFALAKYTLRKTKKYMRRFTVLPLDVPLLAHWMLMEKDPMKIMELRPEALALMGSWSNVHFVPPQVLEDSSELQIESHGGRWLTVDETSGLLVAAMAEKMGILHSRDINKEKVLHKPEAVDGAHVESSQPDDLAGNSTSRKPDHGDSANLPHFNTMHLLHANAQPNVSLLKYFGFNPSNPDSTHPLAHHLKTLSWLQLLAPDEDASYVEPDIVSMADLQIWKSTKRGNYYRKRRRWQRIRSIVDETRAGGFDGLVVASYMELPTILHHLVPLLKGGAQVMVYSPTLEPLAQLADYYSTARRSNFANEVSDVNELPTEDFPVNPTLLLAPTVQTVRAQSWQVLPGRTHPLMMGRGGAEGYIFSATRVLPAEGKVEARGRFHRRKAGGNDDVDVEMDVNKVKVDASVDTPRSN